MKTADFLVQGRDVRVVVQDDGTVYLVYRVARPEDQPPHSCLVKKDDGSEYVVLPDGSCTCPAGQHQRACKHVQWCQELPR